VGLDPGTTTGLAIIDTDADLVAWQSKRNVSAADRNRFVVEHGRPVMVATDVSPAPSAVEGLATTFGTRLFVPDDDLSQGAKKELVSEYDTEGFDSHASDALAAAINAWNSIRPLIRKTNDRCGDAGLADDATRTVLYRVITMGESISTAIATVQQERRDEDDDTTEQRRPDEHVDWEQRARRYQEERDLREEEVGRLREYISELKEDLEVERTRRQQLEDETGTEVRQREIIQDLEDERDSAQRRARRLLNENRELENTNERLEQGLAYAADGERVLPVNRTPEELAAAEGPIVYAAKNLQEEPPSDVEVVIVEQDEDTDFYEDLGLAAIVYHELRGLRLDDWFIVDTDAVIEAAETDTERFMDWLESYRRRER